MDRRQDIRELRTPIPVGIGAGTTERFYLQHLRNIKGYKLKLMPRFFGSDNAYDMSKLVSDILEGGATAICLYDKDVTQWNEEQKQQISAFERQYRDNTNVILCGSMPSIEYWFLMHFKDTTKHYQTSKDVIKDLVKYLPGYEKTTAYLKKDNWVKQMLEDKHFSQAINLSNKMVEPNQPHSNVSKAILALESQLTHS